MKKRSRIVMHEWAERSVGIRTVCGQTQHHSGSNRVVLDLGEIVAEYRCKNCERMRGAIGTSAKKGAGS
jgi:hypothetical protein